jgi:flagellar hook-associated protein 3 FlgL
MKLSFVSSTALATSLRQTISQTQTRLITASTEATTGTYADLGESLGSGTATSIDLRTAIDQAASLKANNSVTSVRLDASQTTLSSLQDVADSLVSNLTALQGSQDATSLTIAQQSASGTISQLISSANTMVNGEYIFAGSMSTWPRFRTRARL